MLVKFRVVFNSVASIQYNFTMKSACSNESSIGAEEGGGADGPGRDGSDRRRECRRRRRCDRYFQRHRTLFLFLLSYLLYCDYTC